VAEGFKAKVRRAYPLDGKRVLILQEDYEGDIEAGDTLEVTMPDGPAKVQVATVAWGSAFHAESPPLTLVVEGLDDNPAEGAAISSTAAE
jgi:hypothetical protein